MADPSTPLDGGSRGIPVTDPLYGELLRRGQLGVWAAGETPRVMKTGTVDVTIPIGTRAGSVAVTHSLNFKSAGIILVNLMEMPQPVGERPVDCHVYAFDKDSFSITCVQAVNAAAARTFKVAYLVFGVVY